MAFNFIFYTLRYFEIILLESSNYLSLSVSGSYKKTSKSSSVKIFRFWYVIFSKVFFNASAKNSFLLFETLLAKSIISSLSFSPYIFRTQVYRVLEINEDIFRIDCHSTRRKKSPYSELFLSAFFANFPAFELNTERSYSVQMWENPGKMRTRITPNADSFYAVQLSLFLRKCLVLRLSLKHLILF